MRDRARQWSAQIAQPPRSIGHLLLRIENDPSIMARPADRRGEALRTSGGRLPADGHELLVGVDRRTSPRVVLEMEVVGPPLGVARVAHVADLGPGGDERPVSDAGVL